MVKTAELSPVVRALIIAENIANEFKLSRPTVHYQINKLKKHKTVYNLPRLGAKRKITTNEDRILLLEFKENIHLKPQSAANEWNETANKTISQRSVRRRLKEANIKTL